MNVIAQHEPRGQTLPWIQVAPGAPYFVTELGDSWTPIGQNDAITWPDLEGLFRRKDIASVDRYLRTVKASGVTCLRLMLEYSHGENRYLERKVGQFAPNMVQLWDDMFALCEHHGLRVLLTPFDTFWMWKRWKNHPYNRANGGPCDKPSRLLLCGDTRAAIKGRLGFAVDRWGGSGALFAWDLWNEIHPGQAEESADCLDDFIADLSAHVRERECRLYGRSHPQTVSMFGPEIGWRPWLDLTSPIFHHRALDFATIHVYSEGTIDAPNNTVDPAIEMGTIVRGSLARIRDQRPFLDTEHGPIQSFKDRRVTLPTPFDNEYFKHLQWAHFASGGAGGGMRWPYRSPHALTPGMRLAQRSLAEFVPLVDWSNFKRRNLNDEIVVFSGAQWAHFACADDGQAIVWLLRSDCTGLDGMLRRDAAPVDISVQLPALRRGNYRITLWDTTRRVVRSVTEVSQECDGDLTVELREISMDVALYVSEQPRAPSSGVFSL